MNRWLSVVGIVALCALLAPRAFSYQSKSEGVKALLGTWEAVEDGETIRLVFKNDKVLEFEGEESPYALVPGAIRVNDPFEGPTDYKYTVRGNVLVLTFPEGDRLEFRRVGGTTPKATNKQGKRESSQAGGQDHLLTGKFMSYSSAGSSSGSSSWTTYVTFDGQGNFEWSSESAHSTQQHNQQGDNTGWGVAYGGNSGNRGRYRVEGDRILVTFPDGSNDEAVVTERFQDGSIGAFKYGGKVYAR